MTKQQKAAHDPLFANNPQMNSGVVSTIAGKKITRKSANYWRPGVGNSLQAAVLVSAGSHRFSINPSVIGVRQHRSHVRLQLS